MRKFFLLQYLVESPIFFQIRVFTGLWYTFRHFIMILHPKSSRRFRQLMSRPDPLVDVCMFFTSEMAGPLSPEDLSRAKEITTSFLEGKIPYPEAASLFFKATGITNPINKIQEIISVPATPLPDSYGTHETVHNGPRKKTRGWTAVEDMRLLAGVHHYGLDRWANVAIFVGGGRTRNQCSQRWSRVLDPKISKEVWTKQETEHLLELVDRYGTKCWMKIAAEMGNRCDVQCRYHYLQHHRDARPNRGPTVRIENPQPEAKPRLRLPSLMHWLPPMDALTSHLPTEGTDGDRIPLLEARDIQRSAPSLYDPKQWLKSLK